MPAFVIEQPKVVAMPVAGSDSLFPVRRVYCIGRNYAAHAVEMKHNPDREPSFFFKRTRTTWILREHFLARQDSPNKKAAHVVRPPQFPDEMYLSGADPDV